MCLKLIVLDNAAAVTTVGIKLVVRRGPKTMSTSKRGSKTRLWPFAVECFGNVTEGGGASKNFHLAKKYSFFLRQQLSNCWRWLSKSGGTVSGHDPSSSEPRTEKWCPIVVEQSPLVV